MNFRFIILSALLALFIFVSREAAAQRSQSSYTPNLEDLPRRVVDTLSTSDPDTKIILYTNNTWSYYRPEAAKRTGELPVFTEHWDTSQVFSYKSIELKDLPLEIDINLISDLSEFHPPFVGKVFSKYGRRGRRNHNGIDIPLSMGEPIYASFEGKVRYAGYNTGGFGNLVIIRHNNGLETWHAHLSKCNVGVNEYVKAGQVIGFGGSTGRSRGPHLHFEVRYCDQTFDPERLFDFENGYLKYQTFVLERSYFNIHSRASDKLEEHDLDDWGPLLANAEGGEVTSKDILDHISKVQEKKPAQSNNTLYHTIRSGDILGKIARQYSTSVDQICRLNNITPNTVLRIGRTLRVR